jgi:hypothetical protein
MMSLSFSADMFFAIMVLRPGLLITAFCLPLVLFGACCSRIIKVKLPTSYLLLGGWRGYATAGAGAAGFIHFILTVLL